MFVDTSQQFAPVLTGAQLAWHSESALHEGTHIGAPELELDEELEVEPEDDELEVEPEDELELEELIAPPVPPVPPIPPDPPSPVSLPPAQATNATGVKKARAKRVILEFFTIGRRVRERRVVYKRLSCGHRRSLRAKQRRMRCLCRLTVTTKRHERRGPIVAGGSFSRC